MEKPEKLLLDDGRTLRQAYTIVLADLLLPLAALSLFWLAWLAIHAVVAQAHRWSTKRDIRRLFENEVLQF